MHIERRPQLQSGTPTYTSILQTACPSAGTSEAADLQVLLTVAVAVQGGAEQAARALAGRQQHRAAAVPKQDACGCMRQAESRCVKQMMHTRAGRLQATYVHGW